MFPFGRFDFPCHIKRCLPKCVDHSSHNSQWQYHHAPRATTVYRLKVDSSGRVALPSELRQRQHIEQGDTIVVVDDRQGVHIKTLDQVLAEVQAECLKSWTRKTGQFRSGGPFALNSLRRLLTNILYTGEIRHKGQAYPGEHVALLKRGIWERVQELIAHPAAVARGKPRNKHLALLSGLLMTSADCARSVDRNVSQVVCLCAADEHGYAARQGWRGDNEYR